MTRKPARRLAVKKRTAPRVKRPRAVVKTSKRLSLAARVTRLEDEVAALTSRLTMTHVVPDAMGGGDEAA